MTRATDHVTDHNELVGLLLTEATRFGYTPVSNGPFTYDDPGHIDEHNLYVDDLKAIATLAGRTFTTALPDTANHGDPGHPADHDLLRAAVTEIQAWPAWNDGTGGTVTEVDGWQGRQGRWRVHTWTYTGATQTFTVTQNAQPFTVGLWGGGGAGKYHFEASPQPTGGAGGSFVDDFTLPTGALSVFVGRGGGAKGDIMYGGWAPSGSTVGTLRAGYGRNGGGAASHQIQSAGDPPQAGNPSPLGDGRENGQEYPTVSATQYGFGGNTSRGGYGKTGGGIAGNGYDGAALIAYRIG